MRLHGAAEVFLRGTVMQWMYAQLVVASKKKKCYATTLIRVVPSRVDSTSPHSGVDDGPKLILLRLTGLYEAVFPDPLKKHPAVVFAVHRGMCTLTDC